MDSNYTHILHEITELRGPVCCVLMAARFVTILTLQHTMTFSMILCFQLCGNSLGKALSCFSMTMPPCTKRGPHRNGLSRLVWKNLIGLHRALISTPLNTFGMNWNADCEPDLIAQNQCPTSQTLLRLNGSKSLQQCSNIEWKAFPEEWRLL